jgi:hypothetical protein
MNLSEWFQELRRRRVIRTLLAWSIACFAVLQVVEPVLHAFHLPDWTLTLVVTLLGIGFPVSAVLAWIFDLTTRGIIRTLPLRPTSEPGKHPVAQVVVRRRTIALLGGILLVAVALTAWAFHRQVRARWALEEALPEVVELIDHGKYPEALALAEQVEQVTPHHPKLLKLWPAMSRTFSVQTDPPGAELWVKAYGAANVDWRRLGPSPLAVVRLPLGLHQWRAERAGFITAEVVPRTVFEARSPLQEIRIHLDVVGGAPPGMVHAPGGPVSPEIPGIEHLPSVELGDYLIDRTEVTNAQFKRFVDAGCYRGREHWKQPFLLDGRTLRWEEAMARFHDRTGRPGPAGWVSGDFPDGQGELPVTGVSWFEAAAYAAFAGKQLPNLYQWSQAAGTWASARIVPANPATG